MRKKDLIALAAITIIGLALRIIFLLAMKAGWPGWGYPTIDALYHHLWALKIAGGDILSGGPYFRAPFYPFLLGFFYAVFGVKLGPVIFIQHLIGALSIPLVYLVSRRFFSGTIALTAAFLTAINGVLIYFESQLLLDFLTVSMMLILLLFIDSAFIRRKASTFFYAGLIAGLFAITRPNILAVIPLIMTWIMFMKEDLKKRVKFIIMLSIGTIILVLPVTIRNTVIGQDSVVIASQGGINFYIGNNEKADGMTALLPGFGHNWQYSDAAYEAALELKTTADEIKPSEVSAYYSDKTLKFIRTHPWRYLQLTIKKLYMFWNYFEISNNNNLYFLTEYIGLSFIPLFLFAIISPLGFVGTILCFTRDRRYWIFPIIIFGYMATVIAFFVTGRFRIPLVPLLTIMAVFAVFEIIGHFKRKNLRRGLSLVSAVIAIGIFAWTNFYNHHDRTMAMAHYSLGNMLMKKGDYDAARREYQTALSENICVPNASLNLGVIAFYEKNDTSAKSFFLNELALCGPNARAYNNLSLLSRLAGKVDSAIAWADSGIAYFPNFKEAYINRILAAFAAADTIDIKNTTERFLKAFPENPAAAYYMGLSLYQRDRGELAEDYFNKAILTGDKDIISEYDLSEIYSASLPYGYDPRKIKGKSYYQLGLIKAHRGDIQSALENFKEAVTLIPNDPDALANLGLAYDQAGDYQNAIAFFDRAISIDSLNAVYYFNYAMTLGKIREYNRAVVLLEKAIELNPDFSRARQILDALLKQLNN